MNFLTLCQALAREAGVSGGTSIPSVDGRTGAQARIVGWIAGAYSDIQGMYTDWKFLWSQSSITTVAGQSDYTLPANLSQIDRNSVRISNQSIEFREYEIGGHIDDASGQPYELVLLPSGMARLHPAPDKAYTVSFDYYRAPLELKSNTDEPAFPAQFHDIVWMRALLKYAYYEAAPEVMERISVELPERMRALEVSQLPGRHRYGLAQDDSPLVVVPE